MRRRHLAAEAVVNLSGKYSLLKTLVLSAVHTASEAAGPAPRGSEFSDTAKMAQYDPHLTNTEAYLSLRVSCAVLLQFAFSRCLVGCSTKVHTPGSCRAATAAVACPAVGCAL